MAIVERDIGGYQLVCADTADEFNEHVNLWLSRGFQPRNGQTADITYRDNGVHFRMEMVRYIPDQVEVDPTAANIPIEEAMRRADRLRDMARQTEAVEEAMPEDDFVTEDHVRPANLWTADSPDPFDGEVDEDEVSDHQLNRLGALMREAVPEHERGLVEKATNDG